MRITKNPKRWKCRECGKEYCFMNGAIKHGQLGGGHYKFSELK